MASAASRAAAVGQRSSAWRAGRSERVLPQQAASPSRTLRFLNTLGQVLRAIDLHFIVGGDFDLAGEVLQQSGWLHAVRARIADVLGLDGSRQGHRLLRGFGGVAPLSQDCGSGRKPHSHPHSWAGRVNAGGREAWASRPKATQARQAPHGCTSGARRGDPPELRCGA